MGYNISRFSVKRNQVQLDQLMVASANVLFPTKRPAKFARDIREALSASWHFPEYKKYYERIYHAFRFKIVEGGVLAELKFEQTVGEIIIGDREKFILDDLPKPPPQSVENQAQEIKPPERKVIHEATTLVDVISMLVKFPNDLEFHFPNVILSEKDKLKLFEFCLEKTWKYIDQGTNGITLTQREDVPNEVLWQPEEEEDIENEDGT